MRSSSGLHVPPRKGKKVPGNSQSVIGLPPAIETLLSSVDVPKPIHELSGDQNPPIAPSVPANWRADSSLSGRSHRLGSPSV